MPCLHAFSLIATLIIFLLHKFIWQECCIIRLILASRVVILFTLLKVIGMFRMLVTSVKWRYLKPSVNKKEELVLKPSEGDDSVCSFMSNCAVLMNQQDRIVAFGVHQLNYQEFSIIRLILATRVVILSTFQKVQPLYPFYWWNKHSYNSIGNIFLRFFSAVKWSQVGNYGSHKCDPCNRKSRCI